LAKLAGCPKTREKRREGLMKFGIFDYLDRRDEQLSQTYEERMLLLQAAD
jgi:hypothetical protein